MAQKGLTKEIVVDAAAEMIEKNGIKNFTIRSLAEDLAVKPASLYNHIDSMDTLLLDVCRLYLTRLNRYAMSAMEGLIRDEAVSALADSYYSYAKQHRELYRLMISSSASDRDLLDDAAVSLTDPLKEVMEDYDLREEDRIHFRRLLRAIIHGFVSEEDIGFFSHYPAKAEDSFRFSVDGFIRLLDQAEKENVK